LSWNLKQKGLIYCYIYANVANRIVWSFVWRKFSSIGIGEWWDEMKYGQKLKLGDSHAPQEISMRYKRQSLGMPPRHPFFIGKNQVTFQHTIYLLLHALWVFLGESLILLSFLFCFVCCNKWLDPNKFLLEEIYLFFIAKNTLVFTLIVQRVFSFSRTAFSFRFSSWFLFRSCFIFISRCIWTSGLCWYSSKELSQKGLNGVGKEKKIHTKKWYKKELV
jgi:hypothetical protein